MLEINLVEKIFGWRGSTDKWWNQHKNVIWKLSYLAQDSRFESSNTIYEEMLNVFSDLRADEKRLRDMEMKMAELTGEDLNKLMIDYDRLFRGFSDSAVVFTYESDIRAILNGFKFWWKACGGMPISDLSGGQKYPLLG